MAHRARSEVAESNARPPEPTKPRRRSRHPPAPEATLRPSHWPLTTDHFVPPAAPRRLLTCAVIAVRFQIVYTGLDVSATRLPDVHRLRRFSPAALDRRPLARRCPAVGQEFVGSNSAWRTLAQPLVPPRPNHGSGLAAPSRSRQPTAPWPPAFRNRPGAPPPSALMPHESQARSLALAIRLP